MEASGKSRLDIKATAACVGTLLLWTAGPIFIRFLSGYLDVWTQNLLRYVAACLFWLPFLIYAVINRRLDNRVWRRAVLPAVANIMAQSLWAAAIYHIDPAFMVLLTRSSVIWIAAFSMIFFAEERGLVRSKRFWLGLVLSVAGVLGVTLYEQDLGTARTMTGIVIALATGVAWSVYTITIRICFRNVDSQTGFSVISIYNVVGFAILAFALGKPRECSEMATWPWVAVVISGVSSIGIGHVLYYVAIRRLGVTVPALVLLGTPFTIYMISSIVFRESLSAGQWVFGIVLLVGCGLAVWSQERLKPA